MEKLPSRHNGKGVPKFGGKQIKLTLIHGILDKSTDWIMLNALFLNCVPQKLTSSLPKMDVCPTI